MSNDMSFLGRGWQFPLRFGDKGQASMCEREEDIQQSLKILFSTSPGERSLRPNYGCNLRAMAFEVVTETNLRRLEAEIRRAVLLFEPRIDLKTVKAHDDDALRGRLLIELEYVIRTTNSRSNMVYPFYYSEGTHLAPTYLSFEERQR